MSRMANHPVLGPVTRGEKVTIQVEGQPVEAYAGEPLAIALWSAGFTGLYRTIKLNQARGFYCDDGTCGECRVHVDGVPNVRACKTLVRDGMIVTFSQGLLNLAKDGTR